MHLPPHVFRSSFSWLRFSLYHIALQGKAVQAMRAAGPRRPLHGRACPQARPPVVETEDGGRYKRFHQQKISVFLFVHFIVTDIAITSAKQPSSTARQKDSTHETQPRATPRCCECDHRRSAASHASTAVGAGGGACGRRQDAQGLQPRSGPAYEPHGSPAESAD